MASKQLVDLLPGFRDDRDENWMRYLDARKQAYLRSSRSEFIVLREKLEQLEFTYQKDVVLNPNRSPVEKQQKAESFEKLKAKFNQWLDQKAAIILDEVRGFKEEALDLREQSIKRSTDEIRHRQEKSLNCPDTMEIEGEVDFVTDDYLPEYFVEADDDESVDEVPSPPKTPEPVVETSRGKKRKELEDSFLKDISQDEANVLVELKVSILKYDCRNDVLQTIKSYKARSNTIKTLDFLTNFTKKRMRSS